jgi:hypothetical protein
LVASEPILLRDAPDGRHPRVPRRRTLGELKRDQADRPPSASGQRGCGRA